MLIRIVIQGFYIEPTVFTDVDPKSEIHCEEIFGPVAVVRTFKTEEEIMQLSNNTNFGLMAGVFTQDINKALRVASDFDSGMVGINCVSLMFMNVRIPSPAHGMAPSLSFFKTSLTRACTNRHHSADRRRAAWDVNAASTLYGHSQSPRLSWSTLTTKNCKK